VSPVPVESLAYSLFLPVALPEKRGSFGDPRLLQNHCALPGKWPRRDRKQRIRTPCPDFCATVRRIMNNAERRGFYFILLALAGGAAATGVMVFAWGSLRDQPANIEATGRFYRAIR